MKAFIVFALLLVILPLLWGWLGLGIWWALLVAYQVA